MKIAPIVLVIVPEALFFIDCFPGNDDAGHLDVLQNNSHALKLQNIPTNFDGYQLVYIFSLYIKILKKSIIEYINI